MANYRTYTDAEVLKIIIESAKIYRDNLVDKNMIFISYNTANQVYDYIETVFHKRNFMHLTGVIIKPDKSLQTSISRIGGSVDFYNLCIKNELKVSDFRQASDGTTPLKISVLPILMKLTGNLMGDFNHSKNYLVTEKLIGNVRGCLGFKRVGSYYIPNTLLQGDIRNLTYKANSVICVLEKSRFDRLYQKVRYIKTARTQKKIISGDEIDIQQVCHIENIKKIDSIMSKVNENIFDDNIKEKLTISIT